MAILNVNTSDSGARLIGVSGVPSDSGLSLTREWPWISGKGAGSDTAVMSLVTTLNRTSSVSNPKANNDQYAGTFVVGKVQAKDETVNGDGDRACTIVQELNKVKTVTDAASLGTPDKGADKATLNYLGFQEGIQEHIYHTYRNLNPANRATAMALSPTESGYTIVKRKWDIEADKTATFYVVFEKDTWPSSGDLNWTSNKVKISYINYDARSNTGGGKTGGAGLAEDQQLTGLSETGYVPELTRAQRGDTNRVVQNVTVIERPNGEYQINQRQAISFVSVTDTAAHIEFIQDTFASKNRALRRVWPRRTYAAKETLIGGSGKAVSSYSYNSDTYVHDNVHIQDNRDGTFDVIQTLGSITGGGGVGLTYYTDSHAERKYVRRAKDDKVKRLDYWHVSRAVASENSGWNWIQSKSIVGKKIIAGTARVTKKGDFYYIAEYLKTDTFTAWQ